MVPFIKFCNDRTTQIKNSKKINWYIFFKLSKNRSNYYIVRRNTESNFYDPIFAGCVRADRTRIKGAGMRTTAEHDGCSTMGSSSGRGCSSRYWSSSGGVARIASETTPGSVGGEQPCSVKSNIVWSISFLIPFRAELSVMEYYIICHVRFVHYFHFPVDPPARSSQHCPAFVHPPPTEPPTHPSIHPPTLATHPIPFFVRPM